MNRLRSDIRQKIALFHKLYSSDSVNLQNPIAAASYALIHFRLWGQNPTSPTPAAFLPWSKMDPLQTFKLAKANGLK
jgi:hypothetical protein